MYSRLDGIFRTKFPGPEAADTGLHIRHDEEKDERHKSDDDSADAEDDESLWTDSTQVSIIALQGFLKGLIAYQTNQTDPENALPTASTPPQKPARRDFHKARKIFSPENSQAAAAYQRTATKTSRKPPLITPTPQPSDETMALTPEEIRAIHLLISDVEDLAAQNVTALSLEPAPNFLQSLIDAAQKAKTRLR